MNETVAQTQAAPPADALAMRQLQHVGGAYLFIFVLLFAFAWRATSATKELAARVAALERGGETDALERVGEKGALERDRRSH